MVAGLLLAGAVSAMGATEAPVGVIEFTPEERAWMAAHPVVRVGHDPTYAPYAIEDSPGKIVGIDPDYLALIARRTGLRFQNEVRVDWLTMMADFKAGQVDMLMSLGYAPEREQFLIYTHAYCYAPDVIVTRDDTPVLFELSDLRGRKIALVRGYAGLQTMLKTTVPDCVIEEYPTTVEAMVAVARGNAYGMITDAVNASYVVKTRHLANLRLGAVLESRGIANENYFGVRKGLPELAGILNKVLASITPAERQAISSRWVGVEFVENRWWPMAFKIAAVIATLAVIVFLLASLHNRRLQAELTERRRIQNELEEAHAQLARVSEEKSELLRMVAHDLRNPLTGILLGTDLLQTADPVTERNFYADTLAQVRTTIAQMIRLTDDLVDVNVLEDGKRVFDWMDVDLAATVREAAGAFAEAAARKQIRLGVETEEHSLVLQSDARALRQICDNLVSNALKYSPAGSAVRIELRRTGPGLCLKVRDEGPGISAKDRDGLFQKFSPGSAKPTGGEKSTGLGLWIVHRMVDGLHGRVWCESELGHGATFFVELPLVPPTA